jgi:hypothetical protein
MIIAFNGAKRHGKGVSAQFAADLLDERTFATSTQVGFADKLKLAAARALGFHDLDTAQAVALMDEFKERGIIHAGPSHPLFRKLDNGEWEEENIPKVKLSGREYLQWFGTEVGRDVFGKDFWVGQVLPNPLQFATKAAAYANAHRKYGTDHVLITDCRFPNEAQRVKALGGLVFEVVRPELVKPAEHTSEKPLPRGLVDATIINDSDLPTLKLRVEQVLDQFGLID